MPGTGARALDHCPHPGLVLPFHPTPTNRCPTQSCIMRIAGYDQIDDDELWQVIDHDLPILLPKLEAILAAP